MIDINNESDETVDEKGLVKLARFALDTLGVHKEAELSIVLVDENTMATYHEKFMGEPGPTDVLSFPMDELRPAQPGGEAPNGVLGDIVLCPLFAERQAEEQGRSGAEELNYLLIHGLLHLLGFTHDQASDQAIMFGVNDQIIAAWKAQRGRR